MKDTITVGGITIDIDIDSDSIPVTADFNPLNSEFDDQLNELIDTTDNILNDLRRECKILCVLFGVTPFL